MKQLEWHLNKGVHQVPQRQLTHSKQEKLEAKPNLEWLEKQPIGKMEKQSMQLGKQLPRKLAKQLARQLAKELEGQET